MEFFELFFYLALAFIVFNIVITMLIISELQKRKFKISFFWLRLYILRYVQQYKKTTLEETGKTGALYYYWLASINLAWILAGIGLVFRM